MLNLFKTIFLSISTATQSKKNLSKLKNIGSNIDFSTKPLTKGLILLREGIDGSNLDTKNTIKDAFLLLKQMLQEIEPKLQLTLKFPSKASRYLKLNNNKISVVLRLGKVKVGTKALVKNVKQGVVLTLQQKLNKVTEILGSTLDASHFHNENTFGDVLDWINQLCKNIDYDIKVKLLHKEFIDEKLLVDKNVIKLKLSIYNKWKEWEVTLKNVQDRVDILKKEKLAEVKNIFSNQIDGGLLNTNHTFQEALYVLNQKIDHISLKPNLSLENINIATNPLKEGINDFDVTVAIDQFQETVRVKLAEVNLSVKESEVLQEKIKASLANLDGHHFIVEDSLSDVLLYISNTLKLVKPEIVVEIKPNTIKSLKEGTNNIPILYALNSNASSYKYETIVVLKNVGTRTSKIFSNIELELLKVDGHYFDSNDRHIDVANRLINDIVKNICPQVKLILKTPEQKLVSGNNEISILLILDNRERQITCKLHSVNRSNEEWLTEISNLLLNSNDWQKDIHFNTGHNYSDVLNEVRNYVLKINEYVNVSSDKSIIGYQKLQFMNDEISITLTLGDVTRTFVLQINNITKCNSDILHEAVQMLDSTKGWEINYFNTDKTYEDVIKHIASLINNDAIVVKLSNQWLKLTDSLSVGDEVVNLLLQLENDVVSGSAFLKKVVWSNKHLLLKAINQLDTNIINWTTDKTYGDVYHFLYKQLVKINSNIKIKLVNNNRLHTKISIDDKELFFNLSLNDANHDVKVTLANTAFCDADLLQFIKKQEIKTFIDKTTSYSYKDIINEYKERVKQLVSYVDFVKIVFFLEKDNLNDYLKLGNNTIKMGVAIGDVFQKITLSVLDVVKSNDHILQEIRTLLLEPLDLNLSSDDTLQTTITKLTALIHSKISDKVAISFRNAFNLQNKLRVGRDEFNIDIKIDDQRSQLLVLKLHQIKESDFDLLNRLVSSLKLFIKNKTTDNTFEDILEEIKIQVRFLFVNEEISRMKIEFVNPLLAKKHLVPHDNIFDIRLQVKEHQEVVQIKVLSVFRSDKDIVEIANVKVQNLVINNWTTKKTYLQLINFISENIEDNVEVLLADNSQSVVSFLNKGTYQVPIVLKLRNYSVVSHVKINDLKMASQHIIQIIKDNLVSKITQQTTDVTIGEVINILWKQLIPYFDDEEIKKIDIRVSDLQDLQTKLVVGDNKVSVIFQVEEQSFRTNIDICDVVLSTADLISAVTEQLENNFVFELTTDNQTNDVVVLMQKHLSEYFQTSRIELSLKEEKNALRKLVVNQDNVKVNLIIDQDQTITRIIKLINIKESYGDILLRVRENVNKDIFNMTTSNTYKDVLLLLKQRIKDYLKDDCVYEFSYQIQDSINLADKLLASDNEGVNFLVSLGNVSIDFKINLLNVIVSDEDILISVINNLQHIVVENYDTSYNYEDVINFVRHQIQNPQIKVSPWNATFDSKSRLLLGDSIFKVQVALNNLSRVINVEIKDVVLSAEDLLDLIKSKIVLNFTNKTTATTYQDIFDEISNGLKANLDSKYHQRYYLVLEDNKLANQNLKINRDTFNIHIIIHKIVESLPVVIEKVIWSREDLLRQVADLLQEVGQQPWKSTQTIKEVFSSAVNKISKTLVADWSRISIELSSLYRGNQKIKNDMNDIFVKVMIDDYRAQTMSINLTNIFKTREYILEEIATDLESMLPILYKTTDDTYDSILQEIINNLNIDFQKVKWQLLDITLEQKKLKVGNNIIETLLNVEGLEQLIAIHINEVVKSDNDILLEVVKELDPIIVDWKTDKIYNDVLKTISDRIINENIFLTFVNPVNLRQHLTARSYQIPMKLQLNNSSKVVDIFVEEVQLTDEALMQHIINLIPLEMYDKTTEYTHQDIIQDILDNLPLNSRVSFQLKDVSYVNKKLVVGNNIIVAILKIAAYEKILKIHVRDVTICAEDILLDIISNLDTTFSGYDTSFKYSDIINDLKKQIANQQVLITIVDDEVNVNDFLLKGTSNLQLNLAINDVKKMITISIVDVSMSDFDIVSEISSKIPLEILNKTTEYTYQDILEELRNKLTLQQQEYLNLSDWTERNVLLKEKDNLISFNIKVNNFNKDIIVNVKDVILSDNDLKLKIQKLHEEHIILEGLNSDSLKVGILSPFKAWLESALGTANFSRIKDISFAQELESNLVNMQTINDVEVAMPLKVQLVNLEEHPLTLKVKDIPLTDNYFVSEAVKKLKDLIERITFKTTEQTYNDVLTELVLVLNDNNVNVQFSDYHSKTKKLNLYNNELQLLVSRGEVSENISLNFHNVIASQHHLYNLLTTFFNKKYTWNFTSATSYNEVLERLKVELEKSLSFSDYSRLTGLEFDNDYSLNRLLKEDLKDNSIVLPIKVKVDNSEKNNAGLRLYLKNIVKTPQHIMEEIISNINDILPSIKNMTTATTYKYVLYELVRSLKLRISEAFTLKFKNVYEAQQLLTLGVNEINLVIICQDIQQVATFTLTNVLLSQHHLETSFNSFFQQYYDWDCSWKTTYQEVLDILKYKLLKHFSKKNCQRIENIELIDVKPEAYLAENMFNQKIHISLAIKIREYDNKFKFVLKLEKVKRLTPAEITSVLDKFVEKEIIDLLQNGYKTESTRQKLAKFFQEKLNWKIQFKDTHNGYIRSIWYGDLTFIIMVLDGKYLIIPN